MGKKNKGTGTTASHMDALIKAKLEDKIAKGWKVELHHTEKVRAYATLIADIYELSEKLSKDEENDSKYLHGVAVMLGEILQEKIEK